MQAKLSRGELKTMVLDFLRQSPQTQVESLLQFGIERPLGRSLLSDESQMVLEMLHELSNANIIMHGADRANNKWPWFGVTAYGYEVLSRSGPPVYDYDGYMAAVAAAVPNIDPTVSHFLSESLRAFQASLYSASMTMLGIASERAIVLLIESYAEAISDEGNREKFRSRINGRDISAAYERFRESFNSTRRQIADETLPHEFDVHVDGIFTFVRLLRNSIAHPGSVPDLSNAIVYANLQQFVYYIGAIFALVRHFQSHKITV